MASLRARLSRRVALRRAVPAEEVDVEQVQLSWSHLSCEEKCTVLRFTDKALVQRLHSHMSALCHADLWRGANGMQEDGATAPERLRGFGFERSAETLCLSRAQGPVAFCATEELAGREDIFEELAEQLGSRFLQGRPALSEKDWLTVVEDLPDSWRGLQLQALRLVELAIFQAHREAAGEALVQQVEREASQHSNSAGIEVPEGPAPLSQSAKRRARKKRVGQQQQQQQQEEEEEEQLQQQQRQQQQREEEEEQRQRDAEEEEQQREVEEQQQHSATASIPQNAAEHTTTRTSTEGSEEAPGQEGHTGHHGDASEDFEVPEPAAPEPTELPSTLSSTWFSWFPSLQKDGTAEWQCRTSQPKGAAGATAAGFRAFVKNTFLHIEPLQTGVDEHHHQHRSRKCRSSKF